MLKNNPLISHFLVFSAELKNSIKESYDLIISLDDEREVCELSSAIKSKKIVGAYLDKDSQLKYTQDSEPWFGMGLLRPEEKGGKEEADRLKRENSRTCQDILYDILSLDKKHNEMSLFLEREDVEFGNRFAERNHIRKDDLVIGLNTGSGKRWPLKRLSEEKTIELINKLHAYYNSNDELKRNYRELKLILFGGLEELERNKFILKKTQEVVYAGCNNTLMNFAAMINICGIVISSDSLAMHMAVALKRHVVAFFAPTSAAEIDLYGKGIKVAAKSECYCCYRKTDILPPNCNDALSVDAIFDAVKNVINSNNFK